jgi:hypothetical protein
MRLRDATLEQVLRQLARDVGGGNVAVGFGVNGAGIVVSTMEDLSREPRLRAYDVHDLISSASTRPTAEGDAAATESRKKLIMTNVATDSWRDNGGTVGTISSFGGKLVVSTTDMVHLEIDRLLDELRRKS